VRRPASGGEPDEKHYAPPDQRLRGTAEDHTGRPLTCDELTVSRTAIAHLKARRRALYGATYFAGLRKAGILET
jgi:hypothetical protein